MFVLKLARREMRSSWTRLLFFFVCVAVGVAAIIALRSIIQNMNYALVSDARLILAADVQLESNRPWTKESLATIEKRATEHGVAARTETLELASMVRPAEASKEGVLMVELKAIEAAFPLYGSFRLVEGADYSYGQLENSGALVAPALLERLGLNVGDQIRIGEGSFEIRGAIDREPGSTGGFRLGPRVFVEKSAVDATGLTGFGSRVSRKLLFRVDPSRLDAFVRDLKSDLKDQLVSVRTFKESEERLSTQFERAENYLSLTGLIILVLGGIGVSSVTRVFVEQKRKNIATLKCLGGTGKRITASYLLQVMILGTVGSLLGLVLAQASVTVIAYYFASSLPQNMGHHLTGSAVLQGLGIGVLISFLFSAVPLLRIRNIKPNLLLRDHEEVVRRVDVLRILMGLVLILGLVAITSWQANSVRIGLFFLGGLSTTAGVLYVAAVLTIFLLKKARRMGPFSIRHSINSMSRPGNQSRVIVMSIGLSAFMVLSVLSVQSNLLDEFDLLRQGSLPNMFLVDIQTDQRAGVEQIIRSEAGVEPNLIPTIRTRMVAIDGRDIDLNEVAIERERGMLGREYVVTYRPNLEANETIVAGTFWDTTPSASPEISVEEALKGLGGLGLGSTITFDIQGRRLEAKVTSFRKVDWRRSRTGFLILFRPGSLDNAPQMLIGAVDGPSDPIRRGRFQRILVDRYPNISVIDVGDILQSIKRILDNLTLGVSFIGGFVFLSGALILAGSIAMTKFQRIYESAVLKTLGAKRRMLLTILLVEYGLLGLVSGLIGVSAASVLSYAVSHYVFDIPWSATPFLSIAGVIVTIGLVVAVGAVASYGVLARKPLSILRSQ